MKWTPCFMLMMGWNAWSGVWKKGSFQKQVWSLEGPIQFLSMKRNGQFYGFHHPSSKNFVFKRQMSNKKMQTFSFPFPYLHISDMDFTLWKKKLQYIISFYDEENQVHRVFLPNGTLLTMPSPIRRCFVFEDPHENMGALIITQEGGVYQRTWGSNETCLDFYLPDPIFRAEFYPPFLYLLDSYQVLHVYCPEKKKIIASASFPFSEPVVRFHAYGLLPSSEIQITAAVLSGSVHIIKWSLSSPQAQMQLLTGMETIKIRIPGMALAVYSDAYKIVSAWSDSSIGIYDVKTGKQWNHYPCMMDPNYFTRMCITDQMMIMDGTLDGLEIYNVNSDKKTKEDMEDFYQWISTPPDKKEFSYVQHLMETPVFSMSQFSKLNWSFPSNFSLRPPEK